MIGLAHGSRSCGPPNAYPAIGGHAGGLVAVLFASLIATADGGTVRRMPAVAESLAAETVVLTGGPYINQHFDTADDFLGADYSCNATAALMAIQHYAKLPVRPITCTRGGVHASDFGFYVSNTYTFEGRSFDIPSSSAWGTDLAGYSGGFGYFLQDYPGDGVQRAFRLSEYIRLHDLESSVDTDVEGERGFSKVCAEIDAGHPAVLLVALAPAGHYVTATGYVRGTHTLICHDPAGDKARGYPNPFGAGVGYDWPGWNHGHENLVAVPRIIYARGDPIEAEAPSFVVHPYAQWIVAGDSAVFSVSAQGTPLPSLQWQVSDDGGRVWRNLDEGTGVGSTTASLGLSTVTTDMNGYRYRCVATNAAGRAYSAAADLVVRPAGAAGGARLVNLSTRAYCGVGDQVTIGGFVVGGNASRRVLIRALGPTLVAHGLSEEEVLPDPVIEIHDHSRGNVIVGNNDNACENPDASEIASVGNRIGATPLAGTDAKSSALLGTFAPGVYSVIARDRHGAAGIVLVEVYDADPESKAVTFLNLASRAYGGVEGRVAIGGFVIAGSATKRVLVRALGPTLATFGISSSDVLADPVIELHDASRDNAVIAMNDNWGSDMAGLAIMEAGSRVGATPPASSDAASAALLITLPPGLYSAVARDRSSGSGIVLLEIYDADEQPLSDGR